MLKKVRTAGILILFISLLTLFPAAMQAAAAPDDDPDVRLTVEGGFNGVAKLGAWTPMRVKALSSREDITGEIQVEVKLDPGRKILVSVPVSLVTGNEQEVDFEIPIVSAYKVLDVKLVENNKTIAKTAFTFKRLLPPEVALVGILSDDTDAFAWLNGNTIPVFQGGAVDEKMKVMMAAGQAPAAVAYAVPAQTDANDAYQIREAVEVPLDRDTFPQNPNVMDGFDYLIVSGFDTALLSDKQIGAMEEWVNTGGNLVLGTGLHWQKVCHGLPDTLEPFAVSGSKDVDCAQFLNSSAEETPDAMMMRLATGSLGFEYVPHESVGATDQEVYQINYFNNDVLAGDEKNPLAVKYTQGMGNILVCTFDLASEPFASWTGKAGFWEELLKKMGVGFQRYYDHGGGYYYKQTYGASNLQSLATNVPSDKKPPVGMMFIGLLAYVLLAGPILYLVLKKLDKRDLAWVLIPVLALVFLAGIYFAGFKSSYQSAVMNTVSLIEVDPEKQTAAITSSIGLFNNKNGAIRVAYDENSGIRTPLMQSDNYMYRGGSGQPEAKVVGKYTLTNPAVFEEYDIMLWTPLMLNAEKTIPFQGNLLENIGMRAGKLTGSIVNTSPYDLLDALVIVGNNIISVGDIPAGDTQILDIPFDGGNVYKHPDEYLDAVFGKTNYTNINDAPPNFQDLLRRRSLYDNFLNQQFNTSAGGNRFTLLARNDQEIGYGVVVNGKNPQQYNQNLLVEQKDIEFTPGQRVEIPGGIILPGLGSTNKVGYMEGSNGIIVQEAGNLDFQFNLPENLIVEEMDFSVDTYIPLYVRYNMENSNNAYGILTNQYEYYLYNTSAKTWDSISAKAAVTDNPEEYIGADNEVRMRVRVVKLGVAKDQAQSGTAYAGYQQEYLSMPEISLKGVAK